MKKRWISMKTKEHHASTPAMDYLAISPLETRHGMAMTGHTGAVLKHA